MILDKYGNKHYIDYPEAHMHRPYSYMKRCEKCGDGKQLGQHAVCPIHNQASATFLISVPLGLSKPKFVDPAMA